MAAGSAQAKIFVDPAGPAGKQYEAPLERARAHASGGGSAGAPGSAEKAPLFGEGISPLKSRQGATAGAGASTGAGSNSPAPGGGVGSPAQPALDDQGGDQTWKVAGLTLAVIVFGAAAGLGIRRFAGTSPS